jgi:hypothetical protein
MTVKNDLLRKVRLSTAALEAFDVPADCHIVFSQHGLNSGGFSLFPHTPKAAEAVLGQLGAYGTHRYGDDDPYECRLSANFRSVEIDVYLKAEVPA